MISRTSLCQVYIPAWRGTWRGRTPGVSLCSWTLWDGGQVGGAGGVESLAESSPGWGTCPALQPLWWFWPRCLLSAFVSLFSPLKVKKWVLTVSCFLCRWFTPSQWCWSGSCIPAKELHPWVKISRTPPSLCHAGSAPPCTLTTLRSVTPPR